jgi:hypothetical protein
VRGAAIRNVAAARGQERARGGERDVAA